MPGKHATAWMFSRQFLFGPSNRSFNCFSLIIYLIGGTTKTPYFILASNILHIILNSLFISFTFYKMAENIFVGKMIGSYGNFFFLLVINSFGVAICFHCSRTLRLSHMHDYAIYIFNNSAWYIRAALLISSLEVL